jgi:ornithine carbamoyltransferase
MGDVQNNVACTLALGAVKLGMDMRLCGPQELWPDDQILRQLEQTAGPMNAKVSIGSDLDKSLPGADFVYTDVWLSMGEPKEKWAERIQLLTPYRVATEVMAKTGNPHAKFMHCLPAFHNTETKVGAEIAQHFGIDCMEVTEDVFEGPASIVFDQGENRMHTIKAILLSTIGA